jgi:hypothetical protein
MVASVRCCSVIITQPLHLSATVSPEFSITVSQRSNLSVSIDGSDILNENVSGNIKFTLQARSPVLAQSLLLAIHNFYSQELWPGTHFARATVHCNGTSAPMHQ